MNRLLIALFTSLALLATARGATIEQVGTGHNWNVTWQAMMGLNDAFDSQSRELDFVGDSSDPGAYFADSGTYVYFRMRVAHNTADISTTFTGAHLLMIDVAGYTYAATGGGTNTNGSLPDFAFAWDSKSNDPAKHGLEMSVLSTRDNLWNGISMDDIDANNAQKLVNDINGGGRTTDGYVRTLDAQSTVNLGQTTFIDFSVSWTYLETYTPLRKGQVWNIALGSIGGATDHNNLNADIGGGASTTSATTVGFTAIPEPNIAQILSLAGVFALLTRRHRARS